MTEPRIRPPRPWTTPCKGTMSLMAAPAPPPELPPGEGGLAVGKSGSRVGFRRDRLWFIWVGGKSPPWSEEMVTVARERLRR